jgi:2-methylcitrate dehydratase PrpD
MMGYTKKLAKYAVDLKYEDLPKEVVHQAKMLTMHTLGVSLAGSQTPQGKRAIGLAKEMSGQKKESTLIGDGEKVGCVQAGLANGTISDVLDWEDCSWTGHPSSGAIPGALAVGEKLKSSGKDFITSVVASYELYERIAMAVQPGPDFGWMSKGWGLTSWVIYSSAVAAAKLFRLNELQMENLIGIAGAMTPTINVNVHLTRTDFYHYQWGVCCSNGITAAMVAQSGISPLPDYLDGDTGYWVTMTDRCKWDWLDKGLGKQFLILETYFKHWPTNMWINQPLDCMDAVIRKHHVKPQDVEKIVVTPHVENRMAIKPEGYKSIVDAEFSIPYCLAAIMHDPEPGPNWYTEEKRNDPKIVGLSQKVSFQGGLVKLQEAFEMFRAGTYPEMSVEVFTKDGKSYKETNKLPKGHPRNMMTDQEFQDRFRRQASFALKPATIEKAIDRIMTLERVADVSEIGDLMHE